MLSVNDQVMHSASNAIVPYDVDMDVSRATTSALVAPIQRAFNSVERKRKSDNDLIRAEFDELGSDFKSSKYRRETKRLHTLKEKEENNKLPSPNTVDIIERMITGQEVGPEEIHAVFNDQVRLTVLCNSNSIPCFINY